MRLKLFSCHHLAPEYHCETEIFGTLVSNLPAPADGSFLSDLDGLNIAGNNLYSELRHQYFVWRNLFDRYDYIGFEQYRRRLFIDVMPAGRLLSEFPEVWEMRLYFAAYNTLGLMRRRETFAQHLAMREALDEADIARLKQWISGYDMIVPRPSVENIEAGWKKYFDNDIYWNTMVEGVNQSSMFRTRCNHMFFQLKLCYFMNMYLMRSDLLDEYLTFCFEVLDFLRARLTLRGRALGYFSERLFSFWIYQKRAENPTLRILELPFVMLKPDDAAGDPRAAGLPII